MFVAAAAALALVLCVRVLVHMEHRTTGEGVVMFVYVAQDVVQELHHIRIHNMSRKNSAVMFGPLDAEDTCTVDLYQDQHDVEPYTSDLEGLAALMVWAEPALKT